MVREAGLTWTSTTLGARDRGPGAARPRRRSRRRHRPFGYRRDERELSPHEQFFMVLLSPRTPAEIKRKLRAWEARVLDGEITPQESQDLQFMYQSFVVGSIDRRSRATLLSGRLRSAHPDPSERGLARSRRWLAPAPSGRARCRNSRPIFTRFSPSYSTMSAVA